MALLAKYSTPEEKKKNFSVVPIDTKKQLDDFFDSLHEKKDSIWRGVPEAKFKLYTSLQRYWIENELEQTQLDVFDYLEHIHSKALSWNNDFLKRSNLAGDSFFSILSILRHHETPTPLLDWSTNPFVALFFASETTHLQSNFPIDNYFSLYELTPQHSLGHLNAKNVIEDLVLGIQEMDSSRRKEMLGKLPQNEFLTKVFSPETAMSTLKNQVDSLSFFKVTRTAVYLIRDKTDDPFSWGINNNYNIINQSGVFLMNVHPSIPLEEIFEHTVLESAQKYVDKSEKDIHKVLANLKQNFRCYDIHKSLKWYVRRKLRELKPSINKEYLFPNFYTLGQDVLQTFLEK